MYWILYRQFSDWDVLGHKSKEKAMQSYCDHVLLYGMCNVKILRNVPHVDKLSAELTITIEDMGTVKSLPGVVDDE